MLWTWSPLLFNSSSCSSALCRLRTRFTCRVRQLDPRCCREDRSLWAWQSLISGCCQPESHFVHFLFLARSSLKPSWFWLSYSLVGCVGHRFVVCHEFLPLRSEHAQEEFMNPNQIESKSVFTWFKLQMHGPYYATNAYREFELWTTLSLFSKFYSRLDPVWTFQPSNYFVSVLICCVTVTETVSRSDWACEGPRKEATQQAIVPLTPGTI